MTPLPLSTAYPISANSVIAQPAGCFLRFPGATAIPPPCRLAFADLWRTATVTASLSRWFAPAVIPRCSMPGSCSCISVSASGPPAYLGGWTARISISGASDVGRGRSGLGRGIVRGGLTYCAPVRRSDDGIECPLRARGVGFWPEAKSQAQAEFATSSLPKIQQFVPSSKLRHKHDYTTDHDQRQDSAQELLSGAA